MSGDTAALSIATSTENTGFSWLVDRTNCKNIIEISNGFITSSTDENLAQEIFTLSAVGEGECNFRIVYANPSTIVSFDDYINTGGLVI